MFAKTLQIERDRRTNRRNCLKRPYRLLITHILRSFRKKRFSINRFCVFNFLVNDRWPPIWIRKKSCTYKCLCACLCEELQIKPFEPMVRAFRSYRPQRRGTRHYPGIQELIQLIAITRRNTHYAKQLKLSCEWLLLKMSPTEFSFASRTLLEVSNDNTDTDEFDAGSCLRVCHRKNDAMCWIWITIGLLLWRYSHGRVFWIPSSRTQLVWKTIFFLLLHKMIMEE